jgi:hypothetical protein
MRDGHPISPGSREFDLQIRRTLHGKATRWRISYSVIDGSKDGFCLAIPIPAAGKSTRGGRITPEKWERRTGLRPRFTYCRRGPGRLVTERRLNWKIRAVASKSKTGRGMATMPIFLLVPQVKLRKLLDLARDAARALDGVPGRIVASWVVGKV